MNVFSEENSEEEQFDEKILQTGENGTLEWTDEGVGNMNVALFDEIIRGISNSQLKQMITKSTNCVSTCAEPFVVMRTMVDLVILCFQTRNCRGGKGEKEAFYTFFRCLHAIYPETMLATLPLISHYGYYKDLFMLLEQLPQPENQDDKEQNLRRAIFDLIANDIRKDEKELDSYENVDDANDFTEDAINEGNEETTTFKKKKLTISLLAKYMPRKNGHFAKGTNTWIYKSLKKSLYPNCHNADEQYRKLISRLSKALEIPEIYMCAKQYHEIKFERVASRCMNKFSKAFLNEKLKGVLESHEEETGNRFPDLEDRVLARQNLKDLLQDKKGKKLNGQQLQPHEIVKKFLYSSSAKISLLEEKVYQEQWNSIREGVLESLQSIESTESNDDMSSSATPQVNLGSLVPLVDVSGSMSGIPIEVAIAMGILVSEVNHPSFRDRFITFSETPSWVHLSSEAGIQEKVRVTKSAPWGFNTDFNKAMDMILEVVKENRLKKDEIPNLIVFSDMEFDLAEKGQYGKKTMHETIKEKFAEVGKTICGEPYEPPMIVYWNLRATGGHVVKANEGNTMILSGFSPSLLKLVLSGEALVTEETVIDEEGNTKKVTLQVTPWDTMRLALDDSIYDPVREVLVNSVESPFDIYTKDICKKNDLSAESSAF